MQCIRVTHAEPADREAHRNWDLPFDKQPVEENHGLQSANMLGNAPAGMFSSEQIWFLHSSQIMNNVYPNSEEMPVFMGLLRAIKSEINVTIIFKLEPTCSNVMGSQAENMIVEIPIERRQPAVFGRGIPKSLSKLTSVVAYLGAGLKHCIVLSRWYICKTF